eukprot:gene11727-24595_t
MELKNILTALILLYGSSHISLSEIMNDIEHSIESNRTNSILPISISNEFKLRPELENTIYVNYLQDGLGSCSFQAVTCNLRSALAACIVNPSGYCAIYLPSSSTISLDSSTYSPLAISMSSIVSFYRLTIFGQGSIIKCLPEGNNCKSRFLSVTNSNKISGSLSLYLFNFIVKGFGSSNIDGGALYLKGLNDFVINTVTFQSNGGGLRLDQYNYDITISNNIISFNIASGNFGGGIYILSSNKDFSFENNTFSSNTAKLSGGAVYIDNGNANIRFQGGSFVSNNATLGGGITIGTSNRNISLKSVVFLMNSANSGGALYIDRLNSAVTLNSISFTNNTATTGNGGAMQVNEYNNAIRIDQSSFLGNRAGITGGAVCFLSYNTFVLVWRSLFIGNWANDGGGLSLTTTSGSTASISNSKDIDVTNCQFYGNYATSNGGSIYVNGVNRIMLKTLQMRNSTAGNYGGGIYIIQSSAITLYNNYLNGNKAIHYGGGIYLQKSSTVSIKQCRFSNSTSEYGSAMYMSSTTNVSMKSCSFINNKALAAGAVYWLTSSNMTEPRELSTSFSSTPSSSASIWVGNLATYGSNYATDKFQCLSPAELFIDRFSGNTVVVLPAITVTYNDYYNQRVLTENSDTVSVS